MPITLLSMQRKNEENPGVARVFQDACKEPAIIAARTLLAGVDSKAIGLELEGPDRGFRLGTFPGALEAEPQFPIARPIREGRLAFEARRVGTP